MNALDPESATFLSCQGGQCYQAGACLLTSSIHPQLLSAREQLLGIIATEPLDPAQLSKLYQQMYSLYAWASEHVSSCALSADQTDSLDMLASFLNDLYPLLESN